MMTRNDRANVFSGRVSVILNSREDCIHLLGLSNILVRAICHRLNSVVCADTRRARNRQKSATNQRTTGRRSNEACGATAKGLLSTRPSVRAAHAAVKECAPIRYVQFFRRMYGQWLQCRVMTSCRQWRVNVAMSSRRLTINNTFHRHIRSSVSDSVCLLCGSIAVCRRSTQHAACISSE